MPPPRLGGDHRGAGAGVQCRRPLGANPWAACSGVGGCGGDGDQREPAVAGSQDRFTASKPDKSRLNGTKRDQSPSTSAGKLFLSGFVPMGLVWAPRCTQCVPRDSSRLSRFSQSGSGSCVGCGPRSRSTPHLRRQHVSLERREAGVRVGAARESQFVAPAMASRPRSGPAALRSAPRR